MRLFPNPAFHVLREKPAFGPDLFRPGLVFGGTREGAVFALDADTGRNLWHFQDGGQVSCNPVSFAVDGKQYVAVAAGNAIMVFGN